MPVAPAASCALCIGRTHTSKRVHRNHPAFPHAMVLTVSFALSPVTGLFCHRRPRTNVVPKPGRADITSANLTPASGRQDHTTSPYAATSLVRSLLIAHKSFNSPCKAALQVTAPFRLADRVEQCALSEPKPTLLQVTGLQLLDPIRTSRVERQRTRRRRRRHPAILCAFLQRALCLRVGGEQWQTRRRDRTIAEMPPTSRAKTPRRRLKLARASTEREGCRFQGRRSRGCCKKHVEYRR